LYGGRFLQRVRRLLLMVGALLLEFVSTADAEDGGLVGGLRKTVRERKKGDDDYP
jgi:hypothetical protein